MKLFRQLNCIAIIVFIIVLQSCSNSRFLKRKYVSGIYLEKFHVNRKVNNSNLPNVVNSINLQNHSVLTAQNTSVSKTPTYSEIIFIEKNNQNTLSQSIEKNSSKKQNKPTTIGNNEPIKLIKQTNIIEKKNNNFFKWFFISLMASFGLSSILLKKKDRVKQVLKRSHRNKMKTKFTIGFLVILNSICSLLLGELFYVNQISLPMHLNEASLFVLITSALLYPKKSNIIFEKKTYLKRKIADLLLVLSSSLLIFSNSYNQNLNNTFKPVTHSIVHASFSSNTSQSQIIKPINETKASSNNIISDTEHAGMKWWQGLIIFFIVLTSIITTLAIAALSCVLSCSGSEALAVIVLFAGTALSIYLCVLGIIQVCKIKITPKSVKA